VVFVALLTALWACTSSGPKSRCGDGKIDPGEQCDDGAFNGVNGTCTASCTNVVVTTTLTANVGINRAIVSEYPGDACSAVAQTLVIDVVDAAGATSHQDVDCTQGHNGWPFYNLASGTATITMQLKDASGNVVTPARSASAVVVTGTSTTAYVDFTYKDVSTSFTGDLEWQTDWTSTAWPDGGIPDGGVAVGTGGSCADSGITQVRMTLTNDQGQVVHAQSTLKLGGQTYTTDLSGATKAACQDYGSSDAELVHNLPWGVYTIKVEGFDLSNALVGCAERALFTPPGYGYILHAHGLRGACP
jgi:cysteine-rich repeat protein